MYLENFSGRGETDGRAEKAGRIGRAGASVGVRAKASECMELGMWGRLWDEWDWWDKWDGWEAEKAERIGKAGTGGDLFSQIISY